MPAVGDVHERVVEIAVHDHHTPADGLVIQAIGEEEDEVERVDHAPEEFAPEQRVTDAVQGTRPAGSDDGGGGSTAQLVPQPPEVGVYTDVVVHVEYDHAPVLPLQRLLQPAHQRGLAGAVEAGKRDQHRLTTTDCGPRATARGPAA